MCETTVLVSLVTLALGYLVLANATKQEGSLKQIGNAIGWIILAVSVVSLILGSYFCLLRSCKMGRQSMMGKKMWNKGMMGHRGMTMMGNMMERMGMPGPDIEIEEEPEEGIAPRVPRPPEKKK